MKSKNPKKQVLKKKGVIIPIVLITILIGIFLSSNFKHENSIIRLGQNKEKLSGTKDIETIDLKNYTEENPLVINQGLVIHASDNVHQLIIKKKDSDGNYSIYKTDEYEYDFILGDVNGDKKVDVKDAIAIWRFKAGEIELTTQQIKKADVNHDGVIDKTDMLMILYGTSEKSQGYLLGNVIKGASDKYETEKLYDYIHASDARAALRISAKLSNDDSAKSEEIDTKSEEIIHDSSVKEDERYNKLEELITEESSTTSTTPYTDLQRMLADINMDFVVTAADAQRILRIAARLETQETLNLPDFDEYRNMWNHKINIVMPEIRTDGEYLIEISTKDGNTETYYFTIDTVAPKCIEITYDHDINQMTNNNITATLKFNEEVATGNSDDSFSMEKTIIFTDNGTQNMVYYDKARNFVIVPVTITNIDKSFPVISIMADTVNSAQNVTLTIIAQDINNGQRTYITQTQDKDDNNGNINSIILKKTGESEKFIQGGKVDDNNTHHVKYSINENGIYEVIATDAAGNRSRQTITITNIDNTLPKYSIRYTPSTQTNQDVEAIITFDEPVRLFDIETEEFYTTFSDQHTITFDQNGEKLICYEDRAGNMPMNNSVDPATPKPVKLKVDWIDKEAPTVKITAQKLKNGTASNITNNITNTDKIKYTFEWSEEVVDFTADDITINNGIKGELQQDSNDKTKYTMEVITSITNGNKGDIILTVPAGVCNDQVQGNIEQQSIITIDKKAPRLENYTIKQEENKIIVETIYDETIGNAKESRLDINIGENQSRGTFDEAIISGNKVTYVYNISGADGGKLSITLKGTVKDIAENSSEQLNEVIENNITLEKNVIKIGDYEYSFSKNGTNIKNFLVPTYFKAGDTIKVTKIDSENHTVNYQYVVEGAYSDNTHMRYMKLTDPKETEQIGTVEFFVGSESSAIDMTEANIYFDTTAPLLELVANTEAVEENIYTKGKEIILTATTSEPITNKDQIPEINVSFSKSGLGKYNYQGENTTKGNAKYINTIENANGTITWQYSYIIEQGDEGSLQVSYVSGQLKDNAENITHIVNINSHMNLNNIHVDTTAPTVEITAQKLAGETLLDITNNITNADKIKYTFKWSEEVVDFTADDITINNGIKGKLTQDSNDKTKYTMEVVTSITNGNKGNIVLTIPSEACKDQAQSNNIEQQSIITIDKKAPRLENYTIKQEGNKIIVETIYDETIGNAKESRLDINIGENQSRGTFDEAIISGNKVTYVYNISGADGGQVSIVLKGIVKDIAGNASEQLNEVIENNITLEKNVIKIGNYEYSFSKNGTTIKNFLVPTYFKAGDTIKVTKIDSENHAVNYQYVVAGTYFDNTHMRYMKLTDPTETQQIGTVKFSAEAESSAIDMTEANIYFDTTAPLLKLVANTEAVEENIYTKGKEIILTATTSEPITNKNQIPEINVSFSKSGLGKYNYQGENTTKGNAKYINTIENANGTISWKYKYIIEQGDEGSLQVSYVSGQLKDNAENITDIVKLHTPNKPDHSYSEIKEFNGVKIKNVTFYKDSSCNQRINPIDGSSQTGDLYIKIELDGMLYSGMNTKINKDTAPNLYLNDNIATSIVNVQNGNTIIYKYTKGTITPLTKIEYITLKNEKCILYTVNDLVSNPTGIKQNKKYSEDIADFYLDTLEVNSKIDLNDIYVDTTAPTVEIIAQKLDGETVSDITNNITNADTIRYIFKWSEKVIGFTKEDITVNNGQKGNLSNVIVAEDGTYLYTMDVTTSTNNGNIDNIQVIVEQNACQDSVGLSNIRTESIIKIDKQAPILIGLEAYGKSNITVDKKIDSVKQYYKQDDTIIITATSTENIQEKTKTAPTLALQFSESGNAKGTMTEKLEGNKIIYTYKIVSGDEGTLSIKGFNGTIVDPAGNETRVTKRALEGETIIADTTAPRLKELNVITEKGTYKAGTTLTIEATYTEDIYILQNNEIKNITSENAPTLKFKFGNGTEKEAVVNGYGTKEDGTTDKTKIIYTYTIVNGDNGNFVITSYNNKQNLKVCDIAGNEAVLSKNQTGNEIVADTERPQVTNITARVENPSIEKTYIYYKEGNKVKIVLTFNEEVSSAAVVFPKIQVGFSENSGQEPTTYSDYAYESDWNVNSTTMEYTYTIKPGDNGYLWVKVPEGQFKDIAGNTNIAKSATQISNIFADTTAPTITLLKDTEVNQENQTITIKATFSENVYDLNGNRRITLTKENAPKLVYSFGTGENRDIQATSVNGEIITYIIKKDPVNDNGTLHYELAKGNLCDRAGNEYYIEKTDTTAPELEEVYISNNGTHGVYCKKDVEIYVTAVFNEEIASANIKLKVKLGEGGEKELTGEISKENRKEVIFTYTVKENDTGKLTLIDITGNTVNDEALEDKTYGYVKDAAGNQKNIYNLSGVQIDGEAIADTTKPYVTNISAKAGEKEIASYQVTENGVETKVGKTNLETTEYIITFSETVTGLTKEDFTLTNGTVKEFNVIAGTSDKQYKLIVTNTFEGVQSLIIPENICEDLAGNENTGARLNGVMIDFTPATVRFISEYNGGTYVLPTNIGKVEIRPNVEINEEISSIEYKWDNEEYTKIENISSASDISIPTKSFAESGTHTLYIKVKDIAGNVTETNKTYTIVNSNITITSSNTNYTNEDITVTVRFGEGLTDNRKVTFKAKDSNEVIELNASGNSNNGTEYTIAENGTIYVEATDRVGGKVYTENMIDNIDKDVPTVTLEPNGGEILIGNNKENGSIKSTIRVSEENLDVIKYLITKETNLTEELKEAMYSVENNTEVIENYAETGIYYLYVIATDKAGNETIYRSEPFIVEKTDLPNFEVYGNPKDWTGTDIELSVQCDTELSTIRVMKDEKTIVVNEYQVCTITENGEYVFSVTDKNGNTSSKTVEVTKIDKNAPVINSATNEGKVITINSTDAESGVAKYAITSTTEVPVEWSNSNTISTTKDGTYYVWTIDNVGNIARAEKTITIDTTAPTITYKYTSLAVKQGELLESNIVTDEDAIISYSWDNKKWTTSKEYVTNIKASKEAKNDGEYTLYAKAKDRFGNESKVQTLKFTVETKNPEIIFEDLPTIQVDEIKYVKIAADMTSEDITAKMNKDMLLGETPKYTELTKDNRLRTGSEITINGGSKYIIIVNGDVNCDGKVTPIDVTMANSIRLNKIDSNTIQKLASDFDLNGKIRAIDITMINSYRLGKIKGI